MGKIKISQIRRMIKGQAGITEAIKKGENCGNCFFQNRGKICGKHYIKISDHEVCPYYSKRSITLYYGGTVSSR